MKARPYLGNLEPDALSLIGDQARQINCKRDFPAGPLNLNNMKDSEGLNSVKAFWMD